MPDPEQKCENSAIFMQNYPLYLRIALEIAYLCLLFQFRVKSRLSRFPPKKFDNINFMARTWLIFT